MRTESRDTSEKKKSNYTARNRKVASLRGESWRESILLGRHEAARYPTHLRLVRLKKSMSQEQIAEAIGVSLATYGGIERGKRHVYQDRAEKLSKYLHLPVSKLFYQKGDIFLARKGA